MKLWNTLTKKYEEFSPSGAVVKIYSCGPTVYNYAHIGNLRAYIFSDTLKRALKFFGYRPKHIINITDVGHLASDTDWGEDKVLVAARQAGKRAKDIARMFEKAFLVDIKKLNILPADKFPRATATIRDQIKLIKVLEKKGYTYKTRDGIYFDTAKFSLYGKLSGQRLEEKEAGARVAINPEKRHPQDFALWKFSPTAEQREMEWRSPWGVGFPGWHIECSAMSRKYLGPNFDIHTGGIDHIPVHHENEIAQSEAAYDEPLARFWLHSAFLEVNGGKMSKSEGNVYTIADLEKEGFDPLAFRYFALGTHYRTPLNFTWEALQGAAKALKKIRNLLRYFDPPKIGCAEFEQHFKEAIADDLNTPKALGVLWQLLDSDYPTHAKAKSLLEFDKVFGLDFKKYLGKKIKLTSEIKKLILLREQARKSHDWSLADKLRQEVLAKGYEIEDTPQGPRLLER